MDTPKHPALDWGRTRRLAAEKDYRLQVEATCLYCGDKRWVGAADVKRRIARGDFTGLCYVDRHIGRRKKTAKPRLDHPQVDWDDTRVEPIPGQERRWSLVAVLCPVCGVKRYRSAGQVQAAMYRGGFTGKCRGCSRNAPKYEWTTLSPGRKVNPRTGYVIVHKAAVSPEHYWLWDTMQGTGHYVTEHRLNMAIKLGRPLTSGELVDHMDGDKQNNDPANLRLYRRGRNMGGDNIGYGTFYDEWQRAEARVRELEERLAS